MNPLSLAVNIDEAKEIGHVWAATANPGSELIRERNAEKGRVQSRQREQKRKAILEGHATKTYRAYRDR